MSSISAVGGSGDAWAAMRSQMQARMFAKADGNGDGGVDKTELSSMLSDVSKMTGLSLDSNIDDTFKSMDGDGDGKLSSDELGEGMQSLMPPPSTMDFARSRSSADTKSSGSSPIDDLFAKADSDGDGSLDKSELKTLADQIKSDTGMAGTVSMLERLMGELKSISPDKSSSQDFAQFAQKMYETFAQRLSQQAQGDKVSAVA